MNIVLPLTDGTIDTDRRHAMAMQLGSDALFKMLCQEHPQIVLNLIAKQRAKKEYAR